MILINELSPNPSGKDTEGEYIKIYNDSDIPASLSGWSIKDASGKTFVIYNKSAPARGFLILDYQTTKISLNNSGDTIYLYDQNKNLVDKLEYNQNISDDVVVKKDITTGKISLSSESNSKSDKADSQQANFYQITEEKSLSKEPLSIDLLENGGIGNTIFLGLGTSLVLTICFWLIFNKLRSDKDNF